ncbi:MAG: indolepyruvate oxidoreductase subunit beta [Deltaproteobacteria bacterium]|nr:indolepyruvate oxidoreductase subunit beta [Deltaproteobacteria bacterium]
MTPRPDILGILVVGVGGQGAITLARLLGEAAFAEGLPVRIGQIHGMSQRGGSVESSVVIGPGRSPFLPQRGADIVVALEPLELQRARPRLHPGTRVVVSSGQVVPTVLALRGEDYPDTKGWLDELRPAVSELVVVDGFALADAAGTRKALGVAMLGALGCQAWLPFGPERIFETLAHRSRPSHREANRRAFAAGRRAAQ